MMRRNFNKLTPTGRTRNGEADHDQANMPERPIDALITDDKEILGTSKELKHFVRDRSRYVADFQEKRIEKAEERVTDPTDTLAEKKEKMYRREKYLEWRDHRVTNKIARHKQKIENSSGSFLSRQINGLREQRVEGLERKKKFIASDAGKLETKRQNKPEELRKKIDEMVRKKVDAMYRKSLREARRKDRETKGISGYNHLKRSVHKAEFIATMSADEKKKIVREALQQAHKSNIESGRLDPGYLVDNVADETNVDIRKVTDDYGRVIE